MNFIILNQLFGSDYLKLTTYKKVLELSSDVFLMQLLFPKKILLDQTD